MDKEEVLLILDDLECKAQTMRENGDCDMRSIIHHIERIRTRIQNGEQTKG